MPWLTLSVSAKISSSKGLSRLLPVLMKTAGLCSKKPWRLGSLWIGAQLFFRYHNLYAFDLKRIGRLCFECFSKCLRFSTIFLSWCLWLSLCASIEMIALSRKRLSWLLCCWSEGLAAWKEAAYQASRQGLCFGSFTNCFYSYLFSLIGRFGEEICS